MNIVLFSLAVIFFVVGSPSVEGGLCDIVPFQAWFGVPSRINNPLPTPVDLVIVTHTVTPECFTDVECQKMAKSIRKAHVNMSFTDLGLSFLVGGNGMIYEGSGWHVGTHSAGFNNRSISLSFIGEFSDTPPTKAAMKTAQQFLGCFLNTRFLGCEYKLVGHRQVRPTLSPGDSLQNIIQTWPHWAADASNV